MKRYLLMSLDSPTKTEKVIAWLKTPKGVKAVIYVILGLVLLGAVLFAADRISGWYRDRQITKARQNVNATAANLKAAQDAVTKDDVEVAKKEIELRVAVNAALEAVNATDEARKDVQAAQSNLANAIHANKPVGTTAADLERRLANLGVE